MVADKTQRPRAATSFVDVRRTIDTLIPQGQRFEIRAKTGKGSWKSGIFDSTDKALRALRAMHEVQFAEGVYIVLNPIRDDAFTERLNKGIQRVPKTIEDKHIAARRWLFIDADPKRPADTSSTEDEHAAALDRIIEVQTYLAAKGWNATVVADSGNGGHLLFLIDLPNDKESTALIQRVLAALSAQFSDERVKIDTTVSNAARIWKLYGTVARKGEDTPERPHRLSRILDLSAEQHVITREMLSEIAATPQRSTTTAHPFRKFDEGLKESATPYELLEHALSVGQEGERNNCGFWLACKLRNYGLSQVDAEPVMREYAARVLGAGYTEREALASLHEAFKRPPARERVTQAQADDALKAVHELLDAVKAGEKTATDVYKAANLLAMLDPAELPAIKDQLKSALTARNQKLDLNALNSLIKIEQKHLHNADALAAENADGKPNIVVNNRLSDDVMHDIRAALTAANTANPTMFRHGGVLTRVATDEHNYSSIKDLDWRDLWRVASRVAVYWKVSSDGDYSHTQTPEDAVKGLIDDELMKVPSLDGVTEIPVLRADGTLLDAPGYDAHSRLYYKPDEQLIMGEIPEHPTRDDAMNALRFIDEMICDFPFVDEPSHANALALLLTPILRSLISGNVPLALLDAPTMGTGKSLFAELVNILATGHAAAMMSAPTKEEEWRKSLTTFLYDGPQIVTIDNVEGKLDSAALSLALTSELMQDRKLGTNEKIVLRQRATWIATGNNINLGGDMPRRCYRIQLDARVSKPWERDRFRIENIVQWAKTHRGELLAALLTIARAWIAAGKPASHITPIGKFEAWCQTLASVLSFVGVSGFLNNRDEMYQEVDLDGPQWEAFLTTWYETWRDTPLTIHELLAHIEDNRDGRIARMLPDDVSAALARPLDQSRLVAKVFQRRKGARFGSCGVRLEKGGERQHAVCWVVRVDSVPERAEAPGAAALDDEDAPIAPMAAHASATVDPHAHVEPVQQSTETPVSDAETLPARHSASALPRAGVTCETCASERWARVGAQIIVCQTCYTPTGELRTKGDEHGQHNSAARDSA